MTGSFGLPDHTMVESVRGPRYCCRECSLKAGAYVEWPCPARFLATAGLLGALMAAPQPDDNAHTDGAS